MNSFEETGLKEEIVRAVRDLGFESPTPIQAKTIPHLLDHSGDLVALAQTGTGKTAAFGLPAIHLTDLDSKYPQTLILCPTRELCLQITNDLQTYAKYVKGLEIVAVYGGASIENQIRAIKRGAQIIVGTPGRTRDLIERRRLVLDQVGRVILDEADEMLTMGFKEELEAILAETPQEKQTLLFSATMSRDIRSVSRNYMHDPEELSVARVNVGAENVTHLYYKVQARDRYEALRRIADINPDIYGIIFCRTRRDTKEVANKLRHDGYDSDALHGDLSQAQRDEVMNRFRKRQLQLLVATDVAARGLDVDDLTHVINYNLPDSEEIYTHRSGRTGRAGKSGISIAIIHTREFRRIRDIEKASGIKFEQAQVPTGTEICKSQLYALVDKVRETKVDREQIAPFMDVVHEKFADLSREEVIEYFVAEEFNRFLDFYKNARDINVNDKDKPSRKERKKQVFERQSNVPFSRLFINVGSKQDLNPARLIGLINHSLNSSSAEIGRIEIMRNFSFFEIEEGVERELIPAMNQRSFQGMQVKVELSENKPFYANVAKEKKGRSNGSDGPQNGKSKKRHRGQKKKSRKRRRKK
ncbi:MAG: DEAD/DEAH box helicase [Bacteroidota bacterium]